MRVFCLVGIVLLMLSCSVSRVAQKPSVKDLVSFYKFDGNCIDSQGSYNGASNHIRYTAFDKRNTQGVVEFGEPNSYINLPNTFDFENRTVSFWVRVMEVPVEGAIIYVSDNPGLQYGLTVFSVRQQEGKRNLIFNYSSQLFMIPIERGKWYHVAATQQDKSYRYYLNGKLVSSGSFTNYTKSDNGQFNAILGCSRAYDRFFNGSLDDLRIYNRALSDAEIGVLATP